MGLLVLSLYMFGLLYWSAPLLRCYLDLRVPRLLVLLLTFLLVERLSPIIFGKLTD